MPETANQIAERIMNDLFNALPINHLSLGDQAEIQAVLLQFVPKVRSELAAFAAHEG